MTRSGYPSRNRAATQEAPMANTIDGHFVWHELLAKDPPGYLSAERQTDRLSVSPVRLSTSTQ